MSRRQKRSLSLERDVWIALDRRAAARGFPSTTAYLNVVLRGLIDRGLVERVERMSTPGDDVAEDSDERT